jgi:phosphohistidine phosphatase
MKRIYLLRHAKSSWDDPALSDFDRPLNKRGRKAAPRLGKLLKKRGWTPDLVLCSTAARAAETWELAAAELKSEPQVKPLKTLYLATPSQMLRAMQRTPPEAASVMLVGHNPGIENLAAQLAGPESKKKPLARLREKFPTAALAVFDFEAADWASLGQGGCRLVDFVVARDLD